MFRERYLNPPLLRGWIGGGGGGGGGAVSSVFTRVGAVVAQTGDYTAAQVTNAADLSSSSQQAFTGEVKTPDLSITGLTGATSGTRYVGATASGAPASGTFVTGDFVVARNGHIFVCTAGGTPGTWVDAGSVGNLVTSVFTRTGAVTAQTGDYTAAQVTNAADKSSASQQNFTAEVKAPDFAAAGLTGSTSASRYVGATASGAPASGTFVTGDFVVAQNGHIFVCTAGGTPGTWVDVGSVGNLVTSVFGRTGAIVATSGDYTAAQITNAADKSSASTQTFTGGLAGVNFRSLGTFSTGYGNGAGGTVTQTGARNSGVTINRPCGVITTDTTSLASTGTTVFTVTNSAVAAADVIILSLQNNLAAGALDFFVQNVVAGAFDITYRNNTAIATTTAFVFNFAVIHGSTT